MPFVIPFALKVVLGIFLFQLALLWLALPFAIYGIKKRMQLAKEQRDELLQEMFWLRKTIETIPGASGVARRQSQKFMQELAEKQKAADTAGDEDKEPAKESKKNPAGVASVKLAQKEAEKEPVAAKKPAAEKKPAAKKPAAKKPAEVNRDNEPQITVPRPAASLLEGGDYEGEDDEPEEYGDEDEDVMPALKTKPKAKKKPPVVDEGEADDTADIEDESLDYLDDDTDPSHLLIDMPLKSSAKAKAQAMTNMVVEIPAQDEISENEEGFFIYRGEQYEHLLDAMKQQQDDAKKVKAS
jgi:hypothetical protein